MIVLDTNVLSELMKPAPDDRVVEWVASQTASSLYTTSITQAEILHGILLLPAGKRRKAFEEAAEAMFDEDFVGRILPFGSDAAPFYADIGAERRRRGRPIRNSMRKSPLFRGPAGPALRHGALQTSIIAGSTSWTLG